MSLEIIDIIFIIILLVFGVNGFVKGFFSQLFTIIGVVLGIILAYFFSDNLSPYIVKFIGSGEWNNLISFILIFLGVLGVSFLLNKIFKEALDALGAKGMDKIFGFCFGLVQGVLACIAFTVMMIYQPFFDSKPIFKDSVLAIKIVDIIPELQKILPDSKAIIKASEDI